MDGYTRVGGGGLIIWRQPGSEKVIFSFTGKLSNSTYHNIRVNLLNDQTSDVPSVSFALVKQMKSKSLGLATLQVVIIVHPINPML